MYDSTKYSCSKVNACPDVEKLDPFHNPCPAGYYCIEGKFSLTPGMLCPEGHYCLPQTSSVEQAKQKLCPAGRYCIQGTPASTSDKTICDKIKQANYVKITLNGLLNPDEKKYLDYDEADFTISSQYINKYCHIGSVCPKDYYCPEGSGSLDNKDIGPQPCPTRTYSDIYSFNADLHCKSKFFTRYVDLDSNGFYINMGDDKILRGQEIYKFKFNKHLLERLKDNFLLEKSFDIIFTFSLDTNDIKNNKLNEYLKANATSVTEPGNFDFPTSNLNENGCVVYLLENISKPPNYPENVAPLQKLPLGIDIYRNNNITDIDFLIITNFQIKMKVQFVTVNSVMKQTVINGVKLTKMIQDNDIQGTPLIQKISEEFGSLNNRYIIKVQADTDILPPLNLNTIMRYSIDEGKREFYLNKLAALSVPDTSFITNTTFIDDFDKMTEPDNLFNLISNYISKKAVFTQFIPYISNCNGLGAYIPIWKLLAYEDNSSKNNSCLLVKNEDTIPIRTYVPENSISDYCDLEFTCRYDGVLESQSVLTNKPWIYAADSKHPLFYLSNKVLKDEAYMSYMGIGLSDNNVPVDFIPVNVFNEKEDITYDYVPKNVNFTMYYYQEDATQKILTSSEIRFSKFESYSHDYDKLLKNDYKLYFKLVAWTWFECMNNFLFPMYWYVLVLILIITLYQILFLIINLIARAKPVAGYIPKFTPSASIEQGLSSVLGWVLGMTPFYIPIIILKFLFSDINIGTLLYDTVSDTQVNIGRIGGSLLMLSISGLYFTAQVMTPDITYFDKNCKILFNYLVKLYSNEIIKTIKSKSKSQFSAFIVFLLLFSIMLAGEYVTVNYILMNINNIYDGLDPLLVTFLQIAGIQFINSVINGFFISMVDETLTEFYVLPFRILNIVNKSFKN
jgi:hypothetical protein